MAVEDETKASLDALCDIIADNIANFCFTQRVVGDEIALDDMSDEQTAASALILLGLFIDKAMKEEKGLRKLTKELYERNDLDVGTSVAINLFVIGVSRAKDRLNEMMSAYVQPEGHC